MLKSLAQIISHYLRHTMAIFLVTVFLFVFEIGNVEAQVNVTGQWLAAYDVDGQPRTISFSLSQDGTVVSGVAPGDSNQAIILGDLIGTTLRIRFGFNELGYSFDLTAQTNGDLIEGTIVDSNSQTGPFAAGRTDSGAPVTLTPATVITEPPLATVSNRNVTLTLKKFLKPVFTRNIQVTTRAKKPKSSFEYQISIKGAERRKITAARNVVTARNLKPGKYTVNYRVSGLKDGKTAFSTKPSPTSSFTIRGKA